MKFLKQPITASSCPKLAVMTPISLPGVLSLSVEATNRQRWADSECQFYNSGWIATIIIQAFKKILILSSLSLFIYKKVMATCNPFSERTVTLCIKKEEPRGAI
jgi:hypothetical protein